jgi:hypothetical protein
MATPELTSAQSVARVFCSYSHKDARLCAKLRTSLAPFEKNGRISIWFDWQILPGSSVDDSIERELYNANLILLLVSPSFIESSYAYDREMRIALERHERSTAVVVPIILRDAAWEETPLRELKALPTDGKAVTSWTNRDSALKDVASGLARVIESLPGRLKEKEEGSLLRSEKTSISSKTAVLESIPELEDLERIEQIERRHERQYGSQLKNISHWNPSDEFRGHIKAVLKPPRSRELIDYAYTYYIDERHDVLERMGYNSDECECLFTASGTISVVCAVNWLKLRKVRRVAILAPYYFSMTHVCRQFGVPATEVFLRRRDGEYTVPHEVLNPATVPALWITNPAYSTSVHMRQSEVPRLRQYLNQGGIIVLDESLAITSESLGPKLGGHGNLLGIHSPHKSIGIIV